MLLRLTDLYDLESLESWIQGTCKWNALENFVAGNLLLYKAKHWRDRVTVRQIPVIVFLQNHAGRVAVFLKLLHGS